MSKELFLAEMFNGKIVLINSDHVQAIRQIDNKDSWKGVKKDAPQLRVEFPSGGAIHVYQNSIFYIDQMPVDQAFKIFSPIEVTDE